jgi:hypothetical protein
MRNDFRCVTVTPTRTPLQVRHEAALELLGRGELDPYEALMLVCWPPNGSRLESVPTERRYYSEELKAEIRERHAAGETLTDLARSWPRSRRKAGGCSSEESATVAPTWPKRPETA